jgi:hypothetical protein
MSMSMSHSFLIIYESLFPSSHQSLDCCVCKRDESCLLERSGIQDVECEAFRGI